MKKIKQILALCLALATLLCASSLSLAADTGYADVPADHWAGELIEKWTGYGVVQGSGGSFAPERELTLGEWTAMLSRVFGYRARTEVDVTPAWCDEYVEQAVAAGILDPAAQVDAGAALTREETVTYLARAYGIAPVDGDTAFSDDADIGAAAKGYVKALQQMGCLDGGSFGPGERYTRVQALELLDRLGLPGAALKAGAGASEIVFRPEMFPVEGFSGEVHTNPYARVLVLEQGVKAAIVSLELVNVPSDVIASVKDLVSEATGASTSHIWVHATHAITTPHAPSDAAQRELYVDAVTQAVTSAAAQAAETFQDAKLSVGTGSSETNANRDIQIGGSWYYGMGSEMPSNHTMTILRFDSLSGEPIGSFLSFGIKPAAIENSEMDENTRKISSDVPGTACRLIEEQTGAPALFCMSAAGDQLPRETVYYWAEENGEAVQKDDGVEKGIEIVERLGAEMAQDALDIFDDMTTYIGAQAIQVRDTSYTWPDKSGEGEVEVAVRGLTIGNEIALVGIKPETNAVTDLQLSAASPYPYTMLMSFVDGDQKYMPDESAYGENETWEAKRAGVAQGGAEAFVSTAAALLEEMKNSEGSALKAGAGAGEILFDPAMFPVEGFSGEIHTNPYARVLVMEQGTKVAIVSLELVNVPADVIETAKQIVGEATGTDTSHIWVHANHTITTPHAPDDADKRQLYVNSVTQAVAEAAAQAAETFQPAVFGVGTGTCEVNANRGIQIGDEWYYGMGSEMPSNHEMTILRLDSLDGETIGVLMSYGIKPATLENSEMDTNTRKISSDVTGTACRLMEDEFDAPVLFCMSAAGDQLPRETVYYWAQENGEAVQKDDGVEKGIEIVERLGAEMAQDAAEIAQSIICTHEAQPILAGDSSYTWPNKGGDGEGEVAVRGITIGESIALIGFKPEVNAVTEKQLWDASPVEHTLMLSFVDGDQKYMPDSSAYDLGTWEFKRAGLAQGAAEQLVSTAVDLIRNIEDAAVQTGSSEQGGTKEVKTIQFAGIDWLVLDQQEDKMLILSSRVLEKRPYHAAGGAVTWEDCDLRAYLNGEFYENTFSDEEKARILETEVDNPSNPQYGIAGGNATTDKVFLLSLREAEQYLGTGTELLRAVDGTGNSVWWHLRSPGEAADVNAGVDSIGLLDYHGTADGVSNANGGVRPAMWVRVD